ncbi:class I SAM-dependent methyltransferase [Amycolatopsis silviterrae]|uniref:Class I SAM-dependent methyltransferase n=1 Tax=Amycolatopsis silviterrae TaxID=1656914 RepID=A0ABW5HH55_9PSEU
MSARADVLAFYRELPFNYRTNAKQHADELRRANPLLDYPPLVALLRERPSLLDVGCGAGWLVNAAAWHYGCAARGIDFNPVVVERAREVAGELGTQGRFEVADLFEHRPAEKFDVVTSMGVLHSTNDCLGGVEHIGRSFVAHGGRMFIGLYHEYARRPFLAHFEAMRRRGASEDAMYAEFRRLRVGSGVPDDDEVFALSWFRDQVLHPHETTHTLAELLPLLSDLGYRVESTSINDFGPVPADPATLLFAEKKLAEHARRALLAGRFVPGFFVFQARRTG